VRSDAKDDEVGNLKWQQLMLEDKLAADTQNYFQSEILHKNVITHIRFNIFPDGGVSRLRINGRVKKND